MKLLMGTHALWDDTQIQGEQKLARGFTPTKVKDCRHRISKANQITNEENSPAAVAVVNLGRRIDKQATYYI